jgi:replication factor C subunit 3/5
MQPGVQLEKVSPAPRESELSRSLVGSFTDAQLRIDQRVFVTPSNRKLDVNVVQSNYHIELTPS